MKSSRKTRSGFTLVEILIVVIILGILAAIVIPQFTNASTDATNNSTIAQLQTLRVQVVLYRAQHQDAYPTTDGTADPSQWDWTKLTAKTTITGAAGGNLGPYLIQTPINPQNNSTSVAATAAAGVGWVLDAMGHIYVVDKAGAQMPN